MSFPDSKVHGANMGPTWGRQDPGGPHVGSMNFALWELFRFCVLFISLQQRQMGFTASQSLATRLFVQQLIDDNSKENIKVLHYWFLCGDNPSVTGGFPSKSRIRRIVFRCHDVIKFSSFIH